MKNIKYDIQESDQIIRITEHEDTDQTIEILYRSSPVLWCCCHILCGMPLNIQCRFGFLSVCLFISLSLSVYVESSDKQAASAIAWVHYSDAKLSRD